MVTRTAKPKAPTVPTGILQLHIELLEIRPKVWRRVLVPETITLLKLHAVIQRAFQWGGGHLHEFEAAGERYGSSDPDYDPPGSVLSERTRLTKAMTRSGTIDYVYDFGDSWQHRVKVEKVSPPMPGLKLPSCIAGANATPPDDCGGAPGYMDFVQAMADPTHEEHADMQRWIGRDCWDAAAFDIDEVNSWLAEIKL
jgi:hypothetical protein